MAVPLLVTAHSGCEGTERDSMDSVKRAIELEVDVVEVDVRKFPDGILRISHDKKKNVSQYTSCESLEDVFKLLSTTSLRINCDVKEREHIYEILSLAKRYGFEKDRLILSGSISPEQLAYDSDIINKATVYMNIEEIFKYLYLCTGLDSINDFSRLMNDPWAFTRSYMITLQDHLPHVINLAHLLGVRTINFHYRHMTEEHFATLEAAGLFVSVWTVDEDDVMNNFLGFSVSNFENVTTRKVSMVRNMLSNSLKNRRLPCDREYFA